MTGWITPSYIDFRKYELAQIESGTTLRLNGKSYVQHLSEEDFIPINLYDKYKREYTVSVHVLMDYLGIWKKDFMENKGRAPSYDHITQEGVKWIKRNCEKIFLKDYERI
jgi:hypothetical protein